MMKLYDGGATLLVFLVASSLILGVASLVIPEKEDEQPPKCKHGSTITRCETVETVQQ